MKHIISSRIFLKYSVIIIIVLAGLFGSNSDFLNAVIFAINFSILIIYAIVRARDFNFEKTKGKVFGSFYFEVITLFMSFIIYSLFEFVIYKNRNVIDLNCFAIVTILFLPSYLAHNSENTLIK